MRFISFLMIVLAASSTMADKKSKFYDFSDQIIDGKIKKPATLFMESRTRAKFDKLLSLKKSFRQELISSAKDPALGR